MNRSAVKPLGIILIIIYSAISAFLGVSVGIAGMSLSSLVTFPFWADLFLIFIFAYSIVLLASTYGLWTMQKWGHSLTLLMYAVSIPLSLILIFPILPGSQMTTSNTVFQLITVAVDFVAIFYLLRPDIAYLYQEI